MAQETETEGRRGGWSVWGVGLMLLVVLQGVKLDMPTIVVPVTTIVAPAGNTAGFAVRLGSAAVSVAWN